MLKIIKNLLIADLIITAGVYFLFGTEGLVAIYESTNELVVIPLSEKIDDIQCRT